VNLSRDPDQEYFADGLAEELLNLLARIPGLRVAGRTSSFAFKGKSEDRRSIGQKLNVATVLEGSVQKAGDRIRINMQLINVADGYHLWSETYDRKLIDVFAVQDEIAQAVVNALKLKLLPGQAPTSIQHHTGNPEVYTRYLLGRQFSNHTTLDGFRRAAESYEKALELEPEFAPAWAGLAQATYWITDWAESAADISEGHHRALAAAEKAVALGPNLAEAFVARGVVRSATRQDWEGAKEDFQRALALSPESPDVQRDYSLFVLRPLGRAQEAIAAARRSAALDPLNGRAWGALGSLLVGAGQLNEAHEALNRSLEVNPDQTFAPYWLGIALLLEGQPAASLAAFQRSTSELRRLTGVALAQHDLGHAKESQQALDAVLSRYSHGGAYRIAGVYAWRGEKDRAFEWLGRAHAEGDIGFALMKMDPLLRGLRGDPRYAALLKKMNLPLD
jgi:TolB-like protein/Tfp pilus assembly protein PilF